MTKNQINLVASLSSGTIANVLRSNLYKDIDAFINWLYEPLAKDKEGNVILKGELAAFGENQLIALKNAVICYYKFYLTLHPLRNSIINELTRPN
jgi:hypothetical protein